MVRTGQRRTTRRAAAGGAPRGFTLVELLVTLLVIVLLLGLLMAGLHLVRGGARAAADTATLNALRMSVEQFKQEHNFLPPLVDDERPLERLGTYDRPRVRDVEFLQDLRPPEEPDLRFSIYSLPYYVVGVLDVRGDGVAGPGFAEVRRDGSFRLKFERGGDEPGSTPVVGALGKRFDPLFDVGRHASEIVGVNPEEGRYELRDRNGVAVRFYRWLPDDDELEDHPGGQDDRLREHLNTPWMVGNPDESVEIRNATFAIVSAGPDGVFGNEHQLPAGHPQRVEASILMERLGVESPGDIFGAAARDNIVVVGR